MPRPQFTIRALLTLTFGAACFFGGIRFEREWQRRKDEAAALAAKLAMPTGVLLQTQGLVQEERLTEERLGKQRNYQRVPGAWSPPVVFQRGPTRDP